MAQASRSPSQLDPEAPLTMLPGIGPARSATLARRGLTRVRDLFLLLPRRVVEWRERLPIAHALEQEGRDVTVRATVESTRLTRLPGRRSFFTMRCADESGALDAVFFNQPWLRERFAAGMQLELFGRIKTTRGSRLIVERVGTAERPLPPPGAFVPQYPAFGGFSESFLAQLVRSALPSAARLVEPLDPALLARHGLPPLARAVELVHAPPDKAAHERGRARLALEPLLALQARLARSRAARGGGARAIALGEDARSRDLFPFAFTAGQSAAVADIRADLARSRPMRRLLQGDVGCGKTAVAAWAAAAVASAGGQVAFLAPTELLAEQHHEALAPLLERAGASSVLFTASLARSQRSRVLERLASGTNAIAFGTHALFSADVTFARLDLAIIDEQQRFGVGQRLALSQKGSDVHLLLMTATPIPRTLAHTLYGDLDLTTIRDRPAGRGSTTTRWLRGREREQLLDTLHERLERGERAFWVCPRLVETSDAPAEGSEAGSESAEDRARLLRDTPLARFGIELVHGRLEREERVERLQAFRSGRARLLVATSVIEVGVDVPEATVLVVEGAERFGLAQLHQLRGRVGRGPRDSACFLLGPPSAAARLALLERESNGFLIAEEDLRQRGMGELAGLRQSGESAESASSVEDDVTLLVLARDLVREDPRLAERYASVLVPDWTDAP